TIRSLKFQFLFNWFLRLPWVKKRMLQKIDNQPAGPNAAKRQKAQTYVWGQVKNANGKTIEKKMVTPEGYTLTAQAAVLIVQKTLAGEWKPGYQTPAACFGQDLVLEIPGVQILTD
ncbi:MAG: hypothetical protein EAZ62_03420, partial [Sphingobacteriia bacterium]